MNPLFNWMAERERIRQRRAAGQPYPWTQDPVLGGFYFTNVMREHDRVSRWVQAAITDWHLDDPGLPVALGLARHLNVPAALERLIELDLMPREGTAEELARAAVALEDYAAEGHQVFTGAYVVTAIGMATRPGVYRSKIDFVVNGTVGQMVGHPLPLDSIEAFTKELASLYCWGGFMAYEVACDLRWARGWLDSAPDIYTWANPGPGARKGLRLLRGLEKDPSPQVSLEMMRRLLAGAQAYEWPVEWDRPLEMRDIEHSLCEFGKYVTISAGGRAKRHYHP